MILQKMKCITDAGCRLLCLYCVLMYMNVIMKKGQIVWSKTIAKFLVYLCKFVHDKINNDRK